MAVSLLVLTAPPSLRAEAPPAAAAAEDDPSRRSRLAGKAYFARNRDVVGATVVVRSAGDPSRVWLTSTDEGGEFRIEDLPDGSYDVRITRPGLRPAVKDAVRLRFPFRAVIELRMETDPAGHGTLAEPVSGRPAAAASAVDVEGVVHEREGGPVAEARVRLVDRTGRAEPGMGETGASGSFLFDELATGRWSLEVLSVGHVPIRAALELTEDTRIEIALVRQPPGYRPSPQDLMPLERPIPPPSLRF
jgi:hypothetical protein